MELSDYLRIIRKHRWLISVTIAFCTVVSVVTSLATLPVYQGSAKLLVVAKTDPAGGAASAYEGTLLSQQLVKSFAQILQSRATAETALRLDPQPLTAPQLQARIHAEPVTETLLIDLRIDDNDPVRAKRLTNSVARAFIQAVPYLQGGSALRVSLVEPALTPTEPVQPKTKLNVALGLMLGLMLGCGLSFLREFLDRSVKTPEELEAAVGVPVVGAIPPFKATKQPVPVVTEPRATASEAFRKLRTNFSFLGVDRGNLCCVITSPAAADGKSTVAANLAIALAQAGQRVVLVDADLRKPSLHRIFGLEQRVGTTTVLLDRADALDALQEPQSGLPAILTSGQLPPNPSELLGSRRMQQLINELRDAFDVVLVDCAPLLPVADPMVVSHFADGVLLVTRAGTTTRDQAHAARIACTKAGATVFGTVLNASPVTKGDPSTYYAHYGERNRGPVEPDPGLDLIVSNGSNPRRLTAGRAARHGRTGSGAR